MKKFNLQVQEFHKLFLLGDALRRLRYLSEESRRIASQEVGCSLRKLTDLELGDLRTKADCRKMERYAKLFGVDVKIRARGE